MFGRTQHTRTTQQRSEAPSEQAAHEQQPDTGPEAAGQGAGQTETTPERRSPAGGAADGSGAAGGSDQLFVRIRQRLFERINVSAAVLRGREELRGELSDLVARIAAEERTPLNQREQSDLTERLLDDMFGVGPIEPLLYDESVTDIMVNGPNQIYVEREGLLELTDYRFRDDQHVINVAQRIAASVGRRVDESSPLCDARLADGSRVNIILPPLALDGASISIRKFTVKKLLLPDMVKAGSMSDAVRKVLETAARCRLNIVVSGGTGSGKTTLLNALSRMIENRERIITIEDSAELQLQQPHVVRLETRPANVEGHGEVSQRDLMRNSLRMRPDRIILGETRGTEAFDVLQAMNTGHDGSMSTIHANSPRDALTRLENMVQMGNPNLPVRAIRNQIVGSINLVVQIARMRDGKRRIQRVTEVIGQEGDVITTQDLFRYEIDTTDYSDYVNGQFVSTRVRPAFAERAAYYGLDEVLMGAMQSE
mgnify:CR=1 FL=1